MLTEQWSDAYLTCGKIVLEGNIVVVSDGTLCSLIWNTVEQNYDLRYSIMD